MVVGTGEVWLGEHFYCGPRLCIALDCGDKTDTNSGVIDEDREIDLTLILPLSICGILHKLEQQSKPQFKSNHLHPRGSSRISS